MNLPISTSHSMAANQQRSPVRILPAHVVNRIAAGEVVERPASVVKELVENALDAGASKIEIDISAGGRTIRVADNGLGMQAEDARLAFYNHATSKIQDETDLNRISTLGFRGEALASIASISRLTCLTRTADSPRGLRITFDATSETPSEPVISETGCAQGTVMEVADLFYNTPARLKFLKRPATELGHIEETVEMLALSHPDVRFQLLINNKTALKTSGNGDLKTTLSDVFRLDKDPIELLPVSKRDDDAGYHLTGFTSVPGVMKSNKRWLLTFVNGRSVRCALIQKAVEMAYESLLPSGRYPVSVLFLTMPPDEVDVNVHPTKKEVRYASTQTLFSFIRTGLKTAMADAGFNDMFPPPPTVISPVSDVSGFDRAANRYAAEAASTPNGRMEMGAHAGYNGADVPTFASRPGRPFDRHNSLPLRPSAERAHGDFESRQAAFNLYQPIQPLHPHPGLTSLTPAGAQEDFYPAENRKPGDFPPESKPRYKVLGQLFNTYILLETAQGLMVVDQHIASERELFEVFSQKILEDTHPAQPLLTSPVLHLSPLQLDLLQHHQETLRQLGFDYALDAPNQAVTLTQIPIIYQDRAPNQSPQALFQDLLRQLEDTGEASLGADHQMNHLIATLACHTAVRAGDVLSHDDMTRVIDGWLTSTLPWTCPHGRPIAHTIPKEELNHFFHRPSLPVNSV